MSKTKRNKGQLLVEVVIAIGVLGLILVGMSELITRSTVSVRINKEKDIGTRLVEARLSYFRQERDRDSNNFFNNIVHNLGGGFTACLVGVWSEPGFSCQERFTDLPDGSGVVAEVRALWTYKTSNDTSVTLSTIISRP